MGAQLASHCNCHRGVARALQGPGSAQDGQDPAIDSKGSAILRIIQITDVYVLENFPHLRNLIKERRAELEATCGGKTVSMLTGDFLAPYLLSSLDNGVGMMSMINGTPIDYLTWGNHEDDIAHSEVIKREREYEGTWINTNMRDHESMKGTKCQKDVEIIEIASADGTNKRSIGMIGILSNSPSLYRPNAFGGATIDDPWETIAEYKTKLEDEQGVDVVIPLCHLYEPQDERTCKEFDFPLILSGHDHHVVDRTLENTRLLKPGLDGHKAWVIDVLWPSANWGKRPVIKAELLTVKEWPADPDLLRVAEKAYSVLDPLRKTQLAHIPSQYRPLSSFNARGCRTSMGTYLLSRIRDALNMETPPGGELSCDTAMLKGGNVRGGRDYADDEHLTLETLQSELEETKEIVVVKVPGLVLKVGLRETWVAPNPGWMQFDDGVKVDADGFVTHVGGEPIDLSRNYKVASIRDYWRKRDAPTIGAYFELHPGLLPEPDAGTPMHALLIRFFAVSIWARIWKALDISPDGTCHAEALKRMDKDGDGLVSREDIKTAVKDIVGLETFATEDTVVDRMFAEVATFQEDATASGRPPDTIQAKSLAQAAKHWSGTSLSSLADLGDSDSD